MINNICNIKPPFALVSRRVQFVKIIFSSNSLHFSCLFCNTCNTCKNSFVFVRVRRRARTQNVTFHIGNITSLYNNVTFFCDNITFLSDNITSFIENITFPIGNITSLVGNVTFPAGNITFLSDNITFL
jgi:hypothetical protein